MNQNNQSIAETLRHRAVVVYDRVVHVHLLSNAAVEYCSARLGHVLLRRRQNIVQGLIDCLID